LTGRSAALDPRHFAVRPDLADVRLASRVFAPHYAYPITMTVTRETEIRAARGVDADVIGTLRPGDRFDVLEITSSCCWGQKQGDGLVGYVASDAVSAVTEQAA